MPTNRNAANSLAGDRGVKTPRHDDRIRLHAAEQDGETHAPYAREVIDALASGRQPNVYLFSGAHAWEQAKKRRAQHGDGSALVLPPRVDPLTLKWPPVAAVVVVWPGSKEFERKLDLAKALIRDGVQSAQISHTPEWICARAKAVA